MAPACSLLLRNAAAAMACAWLSACPLPSLGQVGLRLEASGHYGRLLQQYDFLRRITTAPISGAELTAFWPIRKRDHYYALYRRPERGASIYYSTLGGPEALGREIAATYVVRYYYLRRGRAALYQRSAIGLTYATKPYDPIDNFRNAAVSSRLNVHFGTRLGFAYRLAGRWRLQGELGFEHLSNANARAYNRGLNYVTLVGGVAYAMHARTAGINDPTWATTAPEPPPEDTRALVAAYLGRKPAGDFEDRYSPTVALSLEVRRRFGWVWSLGAGADLTYDGTVRIQQDMRQRPFRRREAYVTGLHLGPVIHYRRWGLGLQAGVYVGLLPAIGGHALYNRALFEYEAVDDLLLRLALRTNIVVLDFAEVGIAYRLPRR